MGKYPNVNKTLEIIYIDRQKMRLSDDSKWQFLPTMPPPSSWKARSEDNDGDKVRPEEMTSFKSDNLCAIIGVSKKDTNTQAMYLGGAQGEVSDINVTKSMTDTEYPANHLEKEWKIRKATDNLIVLEDDSTWELTAKLTLVPIRRPIEDWQPEKHYVKIYKTGSKNRTVDKSLEIQTYEVKNMQTGVALRGTFEGWEKIK